MTTTTNGYAGDFAIPDVIPADARTYRPTTRQEVRRMLTYNVHIYDTLIWRENVILRLPFHRYRVTSEGKRGVIVERVGGKSAAYALAVLLKRLGLEEGRR